MERLVMGTNSSSGGSSSSGSLSGDEYGMYYPNKEEYFITGIIGILLYLGILYIAIHSVMHGIKSKSTRRFFTSVILMTVFEFPRYFSMSIREKYTSKAAYCCHIFAGIFFFVSFSIVCKQWSGLLQLGSYFRFVYGGQSLFISNVSFALVDLFSIIACIMAHSLDDYFGSTAFQIITFIEGVRNCVYSTFLSYYGVKLVKRFWHFSKIERQAVLQNRIESGTGSSHHSSTSLSDGSFGREVRRGGGGGGGDGSSSHSSSSTGSGFNLLLHASSSSAAAAEETVFTKVVVRLTTVLGLSTVCFVFRVCMLIAKMVALHSSVRVSGPSFPIFGTLWFVFSDFIPRGVPTLAFIFIMRTKRPVKDQVNDLPNKLNNNKDDNRDFQFVRLDGDELEFEMEEQSSGGHFLNSLSSGGHMHDASIASSSTDGHTLNNRAPNTKGGTPGRFIGQGGDCNNNSSEVTNPIMYSAGGDGSSDSSRNSIARIEEQQGGSHQAAVIEVEGGAGTSSTKAFFIAAGGRTSPLGGINNNRRGGVNNAVYSSAMGKGEVNSGSSPHQAESINGSHTGPYSPSRSGAGRHGGGGGGVVEFQMESLSHITRQAAAGGEVGGAGGGGYTDVDNTSIYSSDEEDEEDDGGVGVSRGGSVGGLFSKVGEQALDNIYEIISFGATAGGGRS